MTTSVSFQGSGLLVAAKLYARPRAAGAAIDHWRRERIAEIVDAAGQRNSPVAFLDVAASRQRRPRVGPGPTGQTLVVVSVLGSTRPLSGDQLHFSRNARVAFHFYLAAASTHHRHGLIRGGVSKDSRRQLARRFNGDRDGAPPISRRAGVLLAKHPASWPRLPPGYCRTQSGRRRLGQSSTGRH